MDIGGNDNLRVIDRHFRFRFRKRGPQAAISRHTAAESLDQSTRQRILRT